MRKVYFIGIIGMMLAFGVVSPDNVTYAEEICEEVSAEIARADVIVTKYRMSGGVMQYRRWNETRGYWVDPEWINL